MAESAKFSLKLLIDEKRNKVVLAEADQDFVDVLISLLSLPMGKIAKLLENHSTVLGCYKNLNKSVEDMVSDHFETEACKSMLMHPRSTKEIHYRRLKLNLAYDLISFYMCPNFYKRCYSCRNYTNFNTSICSCGAYMNEIFNVQEEDRVGEVIGNSIDGVFVNCRSSFIVTDDLNVKVNSIGVIMKVLNDLGYLGFSDLQETILEVGLEEVLALLGCLFTSETPLTSAFLMNPCMTSIHKMLSPPMPKLKSETPSSVYSVKVFVRRTDREILYAESNEDFVDSLLGFLAFPLELACSLSNDNTILGSVGNLCGSPCRRASFSSFNRFPDYYNCSNNILFGAGHLTPLSPTFECLIPRNCKDVWICKFARQIKRSLVLEGGSIVDVFPSDPKVKSGTSSRCGTGFMKQNTRFIVSNDLTITPMNSSSTIGLLKEMQVDIRDLEEHDLSISREELISILRASLVSSSALTNGLSHLLVKKPKEET